MEARRLRSSSEERLVSPEDLEKAEADIEIEYEPTHSNTLWHISIDWKSVTICILCLMNISTVLYFHRFFALKCLKHSVAPSPMISKGLATLQVMTFNMSTNHRSVYQGRPTPALDAAWDKIIHTRLMALSDEDARMLGKDPLTSVRIPSEYRDGYGDGILVSTEAGHNLHCLNLIRKYTYSSYYHQMQDITFLQNTDETLRGHVNHCIDYIRQLLMCNADLGLITHNWLEGRPRMKPDFNVRHKCRNYDALLTWAEEREIKGMVPPIRPEPGETVFPW